MSVEALNAPTTPAEETGALSRSGVLRRLFSPWLLWPLALACAAGFAWRAAG